MTVLMIERRIIDAPWLVQWRFLIPLARDKSSGDRHANDERDCENDGKTHVTRRVNERSSAEWFPARRTCILAIELESFLWRTTSGRDEKQVSDTSGERRRIGGGSVRRTVGEIEMR
jgi:hypothetical protein